MTRERRDVRVSRSFMQILQILQRNFAQVMHRRAVKIFARLRRRLRAHRPLVGDPTQ